MAKVILLINVKIGKAQNVKEALEGIGMTADIVTGPYDIDAVADGDLATIIDQVGEIEGIERILPQIKIG